MRLNIIGVVVVAAANNLSSLAEAFTNQGRNVRKNRSWGEPLSMVASKVESSPDTDLELSTSTSPLENFDPELARMIEDEDRRQRVGLELIASENFASAAVREALGSCLTNKYSEGNGEFRMFFIHFSKQYCRIGLLSDALHFMCL